MLMTVKSHSATKVATRAKSPIFEAVHETTADLHAMGFIDQRKMRKFTFGSVKARLRDPGAAD